MTHTNGKVYLVGAGPGDPGLITLNGVAAIQNADVVIYDYLASPLLLEHARDTAERIYVGKQGGAHTLSQDAINALIVEKVRQGNVVTRLKGGDPFIFGRGGEEAEILVQEGVPFEIVPGVTSAIAAPAYAGIPLTHRDHTATVALVTGHEDPTKSESSIDWASLARGMGTLVFLMGVKNLRTIAGNLMAHGKSPETPVALVRWGTTSRQKTLTGTLATIADAALAKKFKAPAIIVVGTVVNLRASLQWFENRPLFGKRIVVTRAREQASDLVKRLAQMGAACIEIPTIKVVPPEDLAPLDAAIARLHAYDWIVFTSVNGVRHFFDRLFGSGRDVRALHHIRTACIGPATAERLRAYGLLCDVLPESYHAESVVEAFRGRDVRGKAILLPRAREARSVLPESLAEMGASVDDIAVYRTVQAADQAEGLLKSLREGDVDMVTFTSSSTVKNFRALLPANENPADILKGVRVASIGPITTDTALSLGFPVHVTATVFTIPGLCDAVCECFADASNPLQRQ